MGWTAAVALFCSLAEFAHLAIFAGTPGAGRVGDNEDVVRAFEGFRSGDGQAGVVAGPAGETASVLDEPEIAILVDVKEAVLEVDEVVPTGLIAGVFPLG